MSKTIYDLSDKITISFINEYIRKRDTKNVNKLFAENSKLNNRIKLLEDYIRESIIWAPDGRHSRFNELQT